MTETKVTPGLIEGCNKNILRCIKESFEEHGEVPIIIHALGADGENIVIPIFSMGPDSERDFIVMAFQMFASKKDIVAVVFCSEGWMKKRVPQKGKPNTYETYGRPSEQPDRMEMLLVSFETKNGVTQKVFLIKRDQLKPYLEPFMEVEEPTEISGRFTKFLRKI